MTSENIWLFDLKDIMGIRFKCKKCGAVAIFPPDNIKKVPYGCGNCHEQWLQNMSNDERSIHGFTNTLEEIRRMENDRFAIQFELRNPGEDRNG